MEETKQNQLAALSFTDCKRIREMFLEGDDDYAPHTIYDMVKGRRTISERVRHAAEIYLNLKVEEAEKLVEAGRSFKSLMYA